MSETVRYNQEVQSAPLYANFPPLILIIESFYVYEIQNSKLKSISINLGIGIERKSRNFFLFQFVCAWRKNIFVKINIIIILFDFSDHAVAERNNYRSEILRYVFTYLRIYVYDERHARTSTH